MSAKRKATPSYLLHKQSGRARAVWTDAAGIRQQKLLPGLFDSPESRTAFARLQLELAAHPHHSAQTKAADLTTNELMLAFMTWADTYYRKPSGEPTSEIHELNWSLRPVRELYGDTPAAQFGPRTLAAVREDMIRRKWARSLINRRIDRIKRMFKWAAAEELVPVTTYEGLRTLTGLRKGRTTARESEPVKPVDAAVVDATLPRLDAHLGTMVTLQRLTGMRPGEVCAFQLQEVERSGAVWLYRPDQHKTAHTGRSRVIPIGPKGQATIRTFLNRLGPPPAGFSVPLPGDDTARLTLADAFREVGRDRDADLLADLSRSVVFVDGNPVDPAAPLFSPAAAREERFRTARKRRKSKVPPSQRNRRKAAPNRQPGTEFKVTAYGHAIRKAAEKVGVAHWHPNQLRHLFATEVRKGFGLEAAQVLLGHARADVTQVYAERDEQRAIDIAARIG